MLFLTSSSSGGRNASRRQPATPAEAPPVTPLSDHGRSVLGAAAGGGRGDAGGAGGGRGGVPRCGPGGAAGGAAGRGVLLPELPAAPGRPRPAGKETQGVGGSGFRLRLLTTADSVPVKT